MTPPPRDGDPELSAAGGGAAIEAGTRRQRGGGTHTAWGMSGPQTPPVQTAAYGFSVSPFKSHRGVPIMVQQ